MKYLAKKSRKRSSPKPKTAPEKALAAARHKANQEKVKREQAMFFAHCERNALPIPIPEHRFARDIGRNWRIDYLFEHNGVKVGFEIEGGVGKKNGRYQAFGRHTKGDGFVKDMEKYNKFPEYGIQLFRVITEQVYSPDTVKSLKKLLGLL